MPDAMIVGGNRIPFARSNTAYAKASNQDMLTAALDGLVARFTSDGTLRRARVFRTAVGSSHPSACAVGPAGVFVAGFFAGTTDFAGTTRSSESWSDLFIGHFR